MNRLLWPAIVLALLVTGCSGGDGGNGGPSAPLPAPVASVTVTLAASTVVAGGSTSATASLVDASGRALTGRAITWTTTAPSVAIVDGGGVVTAMAPGTAIIMATSEGVSGSATVIVPPPPIASVVLNGSQRVKVGDSYTYSVAARLADSTVVTRPVTWNVLETGRAEISPSGVLTPTGAGAITIIATIDGRQWEGFTTAYDWDGFSSGGSDFAFLEADNQITNKFGRSEYARLVFVCSGLGNFFGWVSTTNFVTASGLVAYSFDGGTITSAMWDESDDFSTLFKPGNNLVVKSFAAEVAAARFFTFAFSEFNASAKAMTFRVTGYSSRLAPLLARCPGNARVAGDSDALLADMMGGRFGALVSRDELLEAERQLRAARGPGRAPVPSVIQKRDAVPQSQRARVRNQAEARPRLSDPPPIIHP